MFVPIHNSDDGCITVPTKSVPIKLSLSSSSDEEELFTASFKFIPSPPPTPPPRKACVALDDPHFTIVTFLPECCTIDVADFNFVYSPSTVRTSAKNKFG